MLRDTNNLEFLLWILRKRKRFRITGKSMQPSLQPGEEILIDPNAYRRNLPQVNDIVVVKHPYENNLKIVKRITRITEDNKIFLLGDNLAYSTDSRDFGCVELKSIVGKAVARF